MRWYSHNEKNIPTTPAFQYAQDGHFEVVAAGKVDDEVGGGVEDEREVVEAGQAEDPWVDMAWADIFSSAGILLQLGYCYS